MGRRDLSQLAAGASCGGRLPPGLAGVSGPGLTPAHGHGVDEVEQFFGKNGLHRAELLAAVFADENGGEGAVVYFELASSGGGLLGAVFEKRLCQEVAVLGRGPVAF